MCDHSPNREAAMVVVQEGIWCDPCLEPLIRALNDGGLPTVASCCGHGHYSGWVALTDGRYLSLHADAGAHHRLADLEHTFVDGCAPAARCPQHESLPASGAELTVGQ